MSTGKRLAKRSIIGTRVVARGDDGMFYSGMIHAVKTPAASYPENNNCINLTPNTRFSVRFDMKNTSGKRDSREYAAHELVGPGFRGIQGLVLSPGQRVFLTFNGREVSGEVTAHNLDTDEVVVIIQPQGCEMPIKLQKRLDEVRLLESRKSARLADQDTDFARLADMAGDRRRAANNLEMPSNFNPRKRRPSSSGDGDMKEDGDMMDECSAALVLMSLSCSPNSPLGAWGGRSSASPAGSSSGGSWRSGTPSPPLGGGSPASWPASFSDEGIVMDYNEREERPKKKKIHRVAYKCTWPGCTTTTKTRPSVEGHIRKVHLASRTDKSTLSDHEEEFYYTETDAPPPPTLSHRDMCRPPHEDPDYQRQIVGSIRQGLLSIQGQNGINLLQTGPIAIPSVIQTPWPNSNSQNIPHKHMKMSGGPISPVRRPRESKKCRKVYGMEHRESWCTQCKWKKACTRFGD